MQKMNKVCLHYHLCMHNGLIHLKIIAKYVKN